MNSGLRLFLSAHLLSSVGTRMQVAALLWHSYALTESAVTLGLIGAFELVPLLLLSAWGGVVADRSDRSLVLSVAQASQALPALGLAWVTWRGEASMIWIYGATVIAAALQAFDVSARKSLVTELASREELSRAMSVMDLAKNVAKLAGPALMGLLAARIGLWGVYLINAFSYSFMVIALLIIRRQYTADRAQGGHLSDQEMKRLSVRAAFVQGIDFVKRTPLVKSLIALDFMATLSAGAEALLPMIAVERLQIAVEGYGLLASASAVGALLGGVLLLGRPPRRYLGLWSLGSAALYGLSTISLGLSSSVFLSVISLAMIGMADTISTVLRNTLVQLSTPNVMRGRVTALATIFSKSGPRLGQLEAGLVAASFGLSASIISGGVLCLLSVGGIAWLSPTLRRLDQIEPHESQ